MVEVSHLEFGYREGAFQLSVPRLSAAPGETLAIIGPSGTGKTTLLSLIAGILVPRSGTVDLDGTTISALSDSMRREFRIQRTGLVFQEFELLEYLSVLDNILLPYRISDALKLDRPVLTRATELAESVDIADKLTRYPRKLSQGERQRVALCRSLLVQPSVILADEPTGNLDPENRDRVLEIVFDYVRTRKATLITVTHEHEILDRFDRVIDISHIQDAAMSPDPSNDRREAEQ
jgi:putative ABC transport system ATP-binding protein